MKTSVEQTTKQYDLVVIGGGPAGYVAAIRASQLGKKVACVEKEQVGGTCLNWGCIPTKALLRNAELFHLMRDRATEFGFSFEKVAYDWGSIIGRSRKVVQQNVQGIDFLLKKHRIDLIRGEAKLGVEGEVTVQSAEGQAHSLKADKILLATGAKPRPLPQLPFNGHNVLSSRDALALEQQPTSIAIIGAGAIGCEFAYFFNAFGTKVTLIEMQPHLLPQEDSEVSEALNKAFHQQGISVHTGTRLLDAQADEDGVRLTLEGQERHTVEAQMCLVAVGIQPVLPEGANVELTERGYIQVDDNYQTSRPNLYAAGDIIGPPWLAHVASFEATQAVEGMFSEHKPRQAKLFPACTYCQPQVASVGLTEQAARERNIAYKVGKFPFSASGKARAIGEPEGFVKLIFGETYGELLGAHIIGSEATELIAELNLALTLEATDEEIKATMHAHPTLSEAVYEATEQAFGMAIHL
ncbi:dihydrolipoyl dehydrogenase [bacterium]|nr:MAG: dihydrolipoyl dehydrogenase [bacterium]